MIIPLSVSRFTAFSIPLAHLTIHRHKSLLAINDDI